MKGRDVTKLIVSVFACLAIGSLGSFATMPKIHTWYAFLNKPVFNPPSWIFGPVWTTLYIMMGIAVFIVWRDGFRKNKIALGWFAVQLALNCLWSFVFFGMMSPLGGLIVIAALWSAIVMTIIKFKQVSQAAAWLLYPYIAWVSFAAVLNLCVWALNR